MTSSKAQIELTLFRRLRRFGYINRDCQCKVLRDVVHVHMYNFVHPFLLSVSVLTFVLEDNFHLLDYYSAFHKSSGVARL